MIGFVAAVLGFGFIGALGLLAAKRPDFYVRYFLADWQRERASGSLAAISWTGWIIFGSALFTVAVMLIAGAIAR